MDPEFLIYIGNNYGHLQTLFNLGTGHCQDERPSNNDGLSVSWVGCIKLHSTIALGQRVHLNFSSLLA